MDEVEVEVQVDNFKIVRQNGILIVHYPDGREVEVSSWQNAIALIDAEGGTRIDEPGEEVMDDELEPLRDLDRFQIDLAKGCLNHLLDSFHRADGCERKAALFVFTKRDDGNAAVNIVTNGMSCDQLEEFMRFWLHRSAN